MPSTPSLHDLARAVLDRMRDSTWDSRGTDAKILSQAPKSPGTANSERYQGDNPTVPRTQPLGMGQRDKKEKCGTARGTVVGQAFAPLETRCPDHVTARRSAIQPRAASRPIDGSISAGCWYYNTEVAIPSRDSEKITLFLLNLVQLLHH